MKLTFWQSVAIIAVCAICTFAERLFPFIVFGKRKIPPVVTYLGKILPMAVITALVVYCLRGTEFTSLASCVPQLLAVAVTAGLHIWRRNTLVSVIGGTLTYMLLVQLVF